MSQSLTAAILGLRGKTPVTDTGDPFKGLLKATFPQLGNFVAGLRDAGKQMATFSLSTGLVGAFMEGLMEPLEPLFSLITDLGAAFGEMLVPIVNILVTALSPFIPILAEVFRALSPIISVAFTFLSPLGAIATILTWVTPLVEKVADFFRNPGATLKGFFDTIFKGFQDMMMKFLQWMVSMVTDVVNWLIPGKKWDIEAIQW
jgi:phage-related protein